MGAIYSLLSQLIFYNWKKRTDRRENHVTSGIPLWVTSSGRALVNNVYIQSAGNITIGDRSTISTKQLKQRTEKSKLASVATDDRSLFDEENQISNGTTVVNNINIHCAELVVLGNRNEVKMFSNNDNVSTSNCHSS